MDCRFFLCVSKVSGVSCVSFLWCPEHCRDRKNRFLSCILVMKLVMKSGRFLAFGQERGDVRFLDPPAQALLEIHDGVEVSVYVCIYFFARF